MGIENNWEITCNRFVGFIDIMGFKDFVIRNTHNHVYKQMQKISEFTTFNSNIEWEKNSKLIKTSLFSDSLLICSKDESKESLYSIICTISSLSHDLFKEGIPFKGALSYGTMSIDLQKSIFFGQPLIDAYLLQEEVNFYGVIIHGTAHKKIDQLKLSAFVVNYNCLLKKGRNFHLTIAPLYLLSEEDEKDREENTTMFNSVREMRYRTSGYVRNYIDETEKYLNEFHKTYNE